MNTLYATSSFLLVLALAPEAATAEPSPTFTVGQLGAACAQLESRPLSPSTALCTGYVGGVFDGLLEADALPFCIPPEVSVGQAGRVVAKWASDHPEYHHRPAVVAVVASMAKAFPCP